MLIRLIISFIVLTSFNISAQSGYIPTGVENANWLIWDSDGFRDKSYLLTIRGDTIVNEVHYKKVYQRKLVSYGVLGEGRNYPPERPYSTVDTSTVVFLIRDDVEEYKTYVLPTSTLGCNTYGIESVLMDFSLGLGDAHPGCSEEGSGLNNWEVKSEGEIEIYGRNRIAYGLSFEFRPNQIEGIGTSYGLLYPANYARVAKGYLQMSDYCVGTDEACGINRPVSTNDSSLESLTVSPNPASEIITIDGLSSLSGETTISLFDALGRLHLIQSGRVIEEMSVHQLEPGMYYLLLQNKALRVTRKLVVH